MDDEPFLLACLRWINGISGVFLGSNSTQENTADSIINWLESIQPWIWAPYSPFCIGVCDGPGNVTWWTRWFLLFLYGPLWCYLSISRFCYRLWPPLAVVMATQSHTQKAVLHSVIRHIILVSIAVASDNLSCCSSYLTVNNG